MTPARLLPIALGALGALSACADKGKGDPMDDTGASAPTVCEDYSLSTGQELGAADFIATETEQAWIDRASIIGPGVAIADFDEDGFLDLALAALTGSTHLLRNDGTGTLAADLATELPPAQSIAAADLNNDGHMDLYLGTWEGLPDLILLGDGTGAFTASELPDSLGHSTTGSPADVDGDGDLDLMVTRYVVWPDYDEVQAGTIQGGGNILYDNDGSGVFTTTDRLPAEHYDDLSHQAQWLDVDGDNDVDLYLSNDFGMFLDPNALLLNDGQGGLSDPTEDCHCDLGIEAMGVAVGDLDGSGTPDLFITDIGGNHLLLQEDAATSFYDASKAAGVHLPLSAEHMSAWGTLAADLDLDGDLDLPLLYGPLAFWDEDLVARFWDEDGKEWRDSMTQSDVLYLNEGSGDFTDATAAVGFGDDGINKGLAVGDLDRDGRPDLVTIGWTTSLQPRVRVQRGQGGCAGVTVPFASLETGARATLSTPEGSQTQWLTPSTTFSSSAHELYLGMGTAAEGDVAIVLPGGQWEFYEVVAGEVVER